MSSVYITGLDGTLPQNDVTLFNSAEETLRDLLA